MYVIHQHSTRACSTRRCFMSRKSSTGDEPSAGTSGALETITISPDPSPRCSPQPSPQHEPVTHFPLVDVGGCIFTANLAGFAVEERQQEGPLRATSDMPPPSTTPLREGSPARASTDEPPLVEEEPAGTDACSSTPATNVFGEGATSQ